MHRPSPNQNTELSADPIHQNGQGQPTKGRPEQGRSSRQLFVAARRCRTIHNPDICAVLPHLRRLLAIPTPGQQVVPRLQIFRHMDQVHNTEGEASGDGRATCVVGTHGGRPLRHILAQSAAPEGHMAAEARKGLLELKHSRWTLDHIVAACCLRAGDEGSPWQALTAGLAEHLAAWDRIPSPFTSCRVGALLDHLPGQLQARQLRANELAHLGDVSVLDPLLVARELKHMLLKALLCDVGVLRAKPVGIAASVIGRDRPGHLLRGTFRPDHRLLLRQLLAVSARRVRGKQSAGRVFDRVHEAAEDTTAGAEDGCRSGGPPGVLLGPVLVPAMDFHIKGATLLIVDRRLPWDRHEVRVPHAVVEGTASRVCQAAILPCRRGPG
mmetsp:Transcript_32756/g.78333  ORF Transcript_32756/g.78333 Transcript_32756/m.78333 type:complete len:383 (+) Transcript_32756:201-1349(+)